MFYRGGLFKPAPGFVNLEALVRRDSEHSLETLDPSGLSGSAKVSKSYGEFDPGSERTLAAWIRHASRARKFPSGGE